MEFHWAVRQARKPADWLAASQAGVTLVEILVALSIMSMAVLTSVATILIGHQVSLQQVNNADKVQQLRSAMKMMADDLVYAQWDSSCDIPEWEDQENAWVVTRVAGYVVPEHNDPDTWPAAWTDSINWNKVCIFYAIEGSSLIRQTWRNDALYSRQTVLTNLVVSGPSETAMIEVDTSRHLVFVRLMLEETKGEGAPVEYITVSTRFFVP